MKRKTLILIAVLFPLLAFSQIAEESVQTAIPEQEDTTKIVTIDDIVEETEKMTIQSNLLQHYGKVWSRRSFFNVSYNSSTLVPKEKIVGGDGSTPIGNYNSNWGLSLQYGRSYRLHKKPIGNVLHFYMDFSPLDLSFNHYKIKNDGILYDSEVKFKDIDKYGETSWYYHIPWDLEKYEGSFGMSVGPSLSVLPFAFIKNSRGIHYLKFNMYFRLGYQVSILYIVSEDTADRNTNRKSEAYKTMSDNLKMTWGTGLMTNFGLSLTWKGIGIGYEHRVAHNGYKPVTTGDFGSNRYSFKTSTDRIYVSFRMGK